MTAASPRPRPATSRRLRLVPALLLGLAGCAPGGDGSGAGVVARAAGHALTVDRAARLLAANPKIAADSAVVGALADLWVDYTLLATAVAADSTLAGVRIDALANAEREQALVTKLRDVLVPRDPETVREMAEERERGEREARAVARGEAPPRESKEERDHERGEEEVRARREMAWFGAQARYIDSLEKASTARVLPGAPALVRATTRPGSAVDSATARRELATYAGGAVTVGEVRDFVALQPPIEQGALATATDSQVVRVVRQVLRKELLLGLVRQRGLTLTASEDSAIVAGLTAEVAARVRATGLDSLARERATPAAIDARVDTLLRDAITRRRELPTLGRLGAHLRVAAPSAVEPATFPAVLRRVRALGGAVRATDSSARGRQAST